MTIESDYQKAKRNLRYLNSKITPDARERCTAKTMAEQLADLRAIHALELALVQKRQCQDQDDVLTAFEADKSWSGQHARLNSKGWDTPS